MCTARLFSQGVDLFSLKFYLDRVVPHQPFLTSENKRHCATRRRRPHPSAVSREYDGRTDRRTDGYAVAHTCGALYKITAAIRRNSPSLKNSLSLEIRAATGLPCAPNLAAYLATTDNKVSRDLTTGCLSLQWTE